MYWVKNTSNTNLSEKLEVDQEALLLVLKNNLELFCDLSIFFLFWDQEVRRSVV